MFFVDLDTKRCVTRTFLLDFHSKFAAPSATVWFFACENSSDSRFIVVTRVSMAAEACKKRFQNMIVKYWLLPTQSG